MQKNAASRFLRMSKKNCLTINILEGEHVDGAEMADRCPVSAAWIGQQALRGFLEKHLLSSAGLPLPFSGILKKEKPRLKDCI